MYFNCSEPSKLKPSKRLDSVPFTVTESNASQAFASLRAESVIHYGDKPVLRSIVDIDSSLPLDTKLLPELPPPDRSKEQADARTNYFPLDKAIAALDEQSPNWRVSDSTVVVTFRNNLSKL